MTKTPKLKTHIEQNRQTISCMLSGADTHKRLNNVNWLRHELSYTEPRTLFYVPARDQEPYLDYNCMKNLGLAYDYIVSNPNTTIDAFEICRIHSILCADTFVHGGGVQTNRKSAGNHGKWPAYACARRPGNTIPIKSNFIQIKQQQRMRNFARVQYTL